MGEVIIYVDEYKFISASTYLCRICHDEEFESCKNLEAPCACSGTLKFAHRDCIQRWCNEKGNTICEICLQDTEKADILGNEDNKQTSMIEIKRDCCDGKQPPPTVRHRKGCTKKIDKPHQPDNPSQPEKKEALSPCYGGCLPSEQQEALLSRGIALMKFEPGYTAPPPKKAYLLDNTSTTIRGNGRERVVVLESDSEEEGEMVVRSQYSECSQAADRSASCCRTVALIFTILLMMRHLLEVFNGGPRNYPFTLPTLLVIKSTGILLPMYIIVLLITRIQMIIRQQYLDTEDRLSNSDQHN